MAGIVRPSYSPEERAAVLAAALRPGLTDAEVSRLAEAGELRGPDGGRLDAFRIPRSSVASIKTRGRKALRRKDSGRLDDIDGAEDLSPREVAYLLAQEAIHITRRQIANLKADQAKGLATGDQIRQASRAILELSKLPDPARKARPGSTDLGASILADASPAPPQDDPPLFIAPARFELTSAAVEIPPLEEAATELEDIAAQIAADVRKDLEAIRERQQAERSNDGVQVTMATSAPAPDQGHPAIRSSTASLAYRTSMSGPLPDDSPGEHPPIVVTGWRDPGLRQPRRHRRVRSV